MDPVHYLRTLGEVQLQIREYLLVPQLNRLVGRFHHFLVHFFEVRTVRVEEKLELFTHKQVTHFGDAVHEV